MTSSPNDFTPDNADNAENTENTFDNEFVYQPGINIIQNAEGLRLKPYFDGYADWSIGYGFTLWNGQKVASTTAPISKQQADDHLMTLAMQTLDQIKGVMTSQVFASLTDNQVSALISFVYNIGIGNFETSTMLKEINSGNTKLAANQFTRWCNSGGKYVQGLYTRRLTERNLFLS